MSRIKGICEGCKKRLNNAKLITLPGSYKRLCKMCRLSEITKRNKATGVNVVGNYTTLLERLRKLVRMPNFDMYGVSKDELEVLKIKYKTIKD